MSWDTATPDQIMDDIRSWRDHIYNARGKVQPTLVPIHLLEPLREYYGDELINSWIESGAVQFYGQG